MFIDRQSCQPVRQWWVVLCYLLLFVVIFDIENDSGQAEDSTKSLNLIPIPQSVKTDAGNLALDSRFHAGFDGKHDSRLDAALDRFLQRLDRECGGIRRAQAEGGETAANALLLKVTGPGGVVQGIDEDESYSLTITPQSAALAAATDVGAMHGMETLLQLVSMSNGACHLPAVTIN